MTNMYLALIQGNFKSLNDKEVSEAVTKELAQILPGTIEAIDYICTCCETSLCGDMKTHCNTCFDYKVEPMIDKNTSELHVIFKTNVELDFPIEEEFFNKNEFIKRCLFTPLTNADEYQDTIRNVELTNGKYSFKG